MANFIQFINDNFLIFVTITYLLIGFIKTLTYAEKSEKKFRWSLMFLWPFLSLLDLDLREPKGQFTSREKFGWFLALLVMIFAILFAKHQRDSGMYNGTRHEVRK